MERNPSFVFGNAYGAFFGAASSQNDFHQNAALQIIMGKNSDITVIDENNKSYVGRIALIKPLTLIQCRCDGDVTHLYLSPRMDFVLDLINHVDDANIHILTSTQRLPFDEQTLRCEVIDELDKLDIVSFEHLDPRLITVLEDLNQNLDNPSILDAAKRSGLSRSRVRTLAREQLGVPLSTWVTWRKLVEANKALSAGANLSEAALAGSFSDQAHFTRTMKKMFGTTPTEARQIYT